MGAIQNGISGVVGTALGAVGAMKVKDIAETSKESKAISEESLKTQKEAIALDKELQAIDTRQSILDANKEISRNEEALNKSTAEYEQSGKDIELAEKGYMPGEVPGTYRMALGKEAEEFIQQQQASRKHAERAMNVAKDQIAIKKELMENYKKRLKLLTGGKE